MQRQSKKHRFSIGELVTTRIGDLPLLDWDPKECKWKRSRDMLYMQECTLALVIGRTDDSDFVALLFQDCVVWSHIKYLLNLD